MKIFEMLLSHQLIQLLGWALLHFLWQGALVALLLAALLSSLRNFSPQARYLAACLTLLIMPIFPLATIWTLNQRAAGVTVNEATLLINQTSTTGATANAVNNRPPRSATTMSNINSQPVPQTGRFDLLISMLTAGWLIGVLCQLFRLIAGLYQIERLSKALQPVSMEWQTRLQALSEKLQVSSVVRLYQSAAVTVPTVIGWLRPTILLPVSVMTALTTEQLELIIAHELAHIRRHDYLINLLQTIIETLLFYHPAVWWISRQIRIEREQVCDDLVLSVGGKAQVYARALTNLEYLRKQNLELAMAANGGSLLPRIRRILSTTQQSRYPSLLITATTIISTLAIFCLSIWAVQPQAKLAVVNSVEAAVWHNSGNENDQPALVNAGQNLSSEIAPLVAQDKLNGENLEMRRLAIEALGDRAGSVVIMDPHTGQVHTIVNQEWAIRRGWIPASTMKLFTTMAGLTENRIDPNQRIRVSEKSKPLNLTEALTISDNQFFQLLADRVGAAPIIDYAHQFGFGELTGINYENEIPGYLPSAQTSLSGSHIGAFGEGAEVTPIQLAVMASAIANGGKLLVPYVAESQQSINHPTQLRRQINLPAAVRTQLINAMISVVQNGTGKAAYDADAPIAGKTGTVGIKDQNIGLFTSFGPAADAKYVVVVVIRGKDLNGAAAAAIAGQIYRGLNHR